MTDAQKYGFYFPAWTRCAKANQWKMENGRIVRFPRSATAGMIEMSKVYTYARQIAESKHRGLEPDDFRHACHIVALGRDKSSKTLDTKEVNRVVALFDLLADPDDLAARVKWDHPEISEKQSLIEAIKKRAPEAYIRTISLSIVKTAHWEDMPIWGLKKLLRLLAKRQPTFQEPRPRTFTPKPKNHFPAPGKAPAAGPYPKLQYIKKSTGEPVKPAPAAVSEREDNEPF